MRDDETHRMRQAQALKRGAGPITQRVHCECTGIVVEDDQGDRHLQITTGRLPAPGTAIRVMWSEYK